MKGCLKKTFGPSTNIHIGKRLLRKQLLKVIDLVMFDIDNHETEILAVGYNKKTIETKDKWNQ